MRKSPFEEESDPLQQTLWPNPKPPPTHSPYVVISCFSAGLLYSLSVHTETDSVVRWSHRLLEKLHKYVGTQMRFVTQVTVRIAD